MFNELRFALYAMKKNIHSSAELRTSFLMNVIGMAINNTSFVILWIFFVQSVGVINGWTAADIIALQGFNAVSFGLVFSVGAGLRKLPDYVASGSFDRFMLSPKNLLLRVATSAFNASAVGDVVFGIICLTLYALLVHPSFTQILLLPPLVVLSTLAWIAIGIAIFSTSFFFLDAQAITGGLLELFITPTLFHGGAFQGVMRFVFTFIIPSLVVGTLPVEVAKNISLSQLALIVALTCAWFILSLLIFKQAVKKYESSNFMTFGN